MTPPAHSPINRARAAVLYHLRRPFLDRLARAELALQLGRIDKNAYYDLLTEFILERVLRPESVCVDIGCHTGDILRSMMRHAPRGTFHAFEPLPHLFAGLRRDFQQPNVHLHNVALSNAAGEATFNHVVTNPAYSGLVKRKYDRPEERDTSIRVRTERLEEVLSGTPKVDFIKIDVEGAEYLVLEGARNLVLRHKPVIVFEHGKGASDCYGVTPAALHDLLCREYALRISLLADYLRGRPALDKSAFHDQFELGLNYYFIAHP